MVGRTNQDLFVGIVSALVVVVLFLYCLVLYDLVILEGAQSVEAYIHTGTNRNMISLSGVSVG